MNSSTRPGGVRGSRAGATRDSSMADNGDGREKFAPVSTASMAILAAQVLVTADVVDDVPAGAAAEAVEPAG